MPTPTKVDVEIRNGLVVSVWFGCLVLPFEQHDVDEERANEMIAMQGSSSHFHTNVTELLRERILREYPGPKTQSKPEASCKLPTDEEVNFREE